MKSPAWNDVRNLLCVRLDSLGDVLMTTPAIRACAGRGHARRITLLTSPAGAAAARLVPEIDEVIEFCAPWMKATDGETTQDGIMLERLSSKRFDAAVIFTVYSQSPLPAAYLCYLAGIPLRLAHCRENPYRLLTDWEPEREPAQTVRHEVRRQLDLVARVGYRTDREALSFAVSPKARDTVRRLLNGIDRERPLVLVHPGASAASRRYPPESFARAITLLAERAPCEFVFTGDAGEQALVDGIRTAIGAPARSLVGRLSLAELGALLERADLLISNNTGPVHIAAALGTPVVDLYALTNPQHTPWQVQSRVLFHDVPCRYCYKSVCLAGHHDCLRRVTPEAVAAAAEELLVSHVYARN